MIFKMNSRIDLQKYAEDDDDDGKGKNNSWEQDQNLKQSWETGRKVQKSYPSKPIIHTGEVTSEKKKNILGTSWQGYNAAQRELGLSISSKFNACMIK